jgi:GDP-D-mannose dehydratase
LGWEPAVNFEQLIEMMVKAEIASLTERLSR